MAKAKDWRAGEKKKTHEEARYARYGDEKEHCGGCSMFHDREKDRCDLVQDPIDWFGWCRYFEKK
jgi:hypothetical protein